MHGKHRWVWKVCTTLPCNNNVPLMKINSNDDGSLNSSECEVCTAVKWMFFSFTCWKLLISKSETNRNLPYIKIQLCPLVYVDQAQSTHDYSHYDSIRGQYVVQIHCRITHIWMGEFKANLNITSTFHCCFCSSETHILKNISGIICFTPCCCWRVRWLPGNYRIHPQLMLLPAQDELASQTNTVLYFLMLLLSYTSTVSFFNIKHLICLRLCQQMVLYFSLSEFVFLITSQT